MPSPKTEDRRSMVFRLRKQALDWLEAHPEEPPKTWWQHLADAFGRMGDAFVMDWGEPSDPGDVAQDIYARAQETMNRAWCKAMVETLDQVIQDEGWDGDGQE